MSQDLYSKCDAALLPMIHARVESLAPLVASRALVMKKRLAAPRVAAAGGRRASGAGPKPKATAIAKMVVFIECDDKTKLGGTAAEDIQVNTSQGTVRTAYLPLSSIAKIAENDGVHRISASRKLRRCLDKALPAVNVPAFKTSGKLTGKGVVVGIIDSGIDGKHAAFKGRLLNVWDQTKKGKGVKEGSYGVEYKGAAVSKAVDDDVGHGTHVAGVATSADENYRGVAHEAQLVAVRTDFENAHILDGIRYVFRIAKDLGLPAVVNLSLGGHWDAHDGTDPLSRGIDEITGPGQIVCCAAGNEGEDNIHAQIDIPVGEERGVRFAVPANTAHNPSITAWYNSPGHALEVEVRSPSGSVTPWQAVITAGNPVTLNTLGSDLVITTTQPPQAGGNGAHEIQVEIRGGGDATSTVKGGNWQLRLRNTSAAKVRVDAWIIDAESIQGSLFTGLEAQDAMKIGSPGSSATAITVAAYTTRKTWPLLNGSTNTDNVPLNEIAAFSSEGPLRRGQQKPDIAAPGQWIVSTRARQVPKDKEFCVSAGFLAMQGTSMACPFITGIVALLLQRNPKLTPQEAKKLLFQSASIPGKPAGTFSQRWGRGVIDAAKL